MKHALYNLTDEQFAFFVDKIGVDLDGRDIPHIFVGGTAVQAHVLSRLTKKYEQPMDSLEGSVRVQDYIRSTDDVDLALRFPEDMPDTEVGRKIKDFCESIPGEYIPGTENHIIAYTLERMGLKRPVFGVSVDDKSGEPISMNISKKPSDLNKLNTKYYNVFLEEGQELDLPFSEDYSFRVRVPRVEHVLATKISNFRAKDAMDLKNLVSVVEDVGESINLGEVRSILGPENTRKYEQFESLMGKYSSE